MSLWLVLLCTSGVLLTVGFAIDTHHKMNNRKIDYAQLSLKTKKNFGVSSYFM
ncbi:hypothetical protein [Cytobacillus gottheilii]|uniref:hypothetical protein n=1 Tax=Cytobacillus gottheilii TaxID=859144 RepID=UPI001593CECF|nr:hypothetical protein [Cytobacillus gottheilii]